MVGCDSAGLHSGHIGISYGMYQVPGTLVFIVAVESRRKPTINNFMVYTRAGT